MPSNSTQVNSAWRAGISAQSTITGNQEFLTSTNGILNVSGGGSGGGGTQYTQGGATVTNPTGNSLIYFNGSNQPIAVTTANPLPITGTISVGSTTDESAFTAGTSTTGPIAGVFNDSLTGISSGQQGTVRMTALRGLHTNLRNNSGTEVGTAATPLQVSLANTASNATAITVTANAGSGAFTIQGAVASGSANGNNPVKTGGVFNTTQPTVTNGQVVDLQATARGAQIVATGVDALVVSQSTAASLNATVVGTGTLAVQNTAATPAGTNLIGKIGVDQTTPGTTNNVSVSGSSGASTSNLIKDDTQFGDGVTTGILSSTNRLYNGSTYDRARGDATNGAWVNVKTGTVGTTSAVINVGQQTVSTTAVQVSASSTVPTNGIIIQALSTNAGSIFVGGSGVTTSTGFELVAGQAMSFTCNLNTIFIRSASSTTDKICYNVE